MPDLPHAVPSHGTIESNTFRWYLLEDIMAAPVNESWVLLVSTKHPAYAFYLDLLRKADPLPLKYIRAVPFIQLKALVTVNCQYNGLCRGLMSKLEIERLLFGNGNGAVLLYFIGADVTLQVLWREFSDNLETIQVWGQRPCKRWFYDALHNHVNVDTRRALFQRLVEEVDGD
jgi:hypothetical protein